MNLFTRWTDALDTLKAQGRFRALKLPHGIDFTSNDYLGYRTRSQKSVVSSQRSEVRDQVTGHRSEVIAFVSSDL